MNATVSKIVLDSAGLSAYRLSEVRATGAAVILLVAVALLRPSSLKTRPRELGFLVVFGICGLALVQLFYFVALTRLNIGIALVIEYIAPVLVALYARFFVREPVRRRLWAAIALSLAGLSLVVDLWSGVTLSTTGIFACLAAAVAYALYIVMADRSLRSGRDAASLLAYGFLFASIFWAFVQPWWSFPAESIATSASLLGRLDEFSAPVWLLLGYVVVLGTVVPFVLIVSALHHISPTRTVIVAMLEPVLAAAVAYAWLGEELTGQQIAGSLLVLAGIFLAQTAREVEPTGAEAESGPR